MVFCIPFFFWIGCPGKAQFLAAWLIIFVFPGAACCQSFGTAPGNYLGFSLIASCNAFWHLSNDITFLDHGKLCSPYRKNQKNS
jgi:hypothetical protein